MFEYFLWFRSIFWNKFATWKLRRKKFYRIQLQQTKWAMERMNPALEGASIGAVPWDRRTYTKSKVTSLCPISSNSQHFAATARISSGENKNNVHISRGNWRFKFNNKISEASWAFKQKIWESSHLSYRDVFPSFHPVWSEVNPNSVIRSLLTRNSLLEAMMMCFCHFKTFMWKDFQVFLFHHQRQMLTNEERLFKILLNYFRGFGKQGFQCKGE